MCEGVTRLPWWNIQIVVQVVDVHLSVAETPSWSNVKIPNNFVDAKASFYTAALALLLVKSL